ncbi:MAG: hypothetical protein K2N63_07930 [Lachnospiraceae bacterium]|nr:hypothetical protein [Lachnospiraceae bacterium]
MSEQQKCKVVCLGDSITEGFGLGEYENYPYLLQCALGDGFFVFNAGVSAHCVTNEILPDGRIMGLPYVRTERYAQGIAEKGDIYVIVLGTNDAQDGMLDDGSAIDPWGNIISKCGNFIGHYERILNDIRLANPKARICIGRPTPILNCIWPKHRQEYLDVILEKIDEIGRRNPDVVLFDLYGAFREKGDEWMYRIYQEDRLHPGPAGAKLIAQIVYGVVMGMG